MKTIAACLIVGIYSCLFPVIPLNKNSNAASLIHILLWRIRIQDSRFLLIIIFAHFASNLPKNFAYDTFKNSNYSSLKIFSHVSQEISPEIDPAIVLSVLLKFRTRLQKYKNSSRFTDFFLTHGWEVSLRMP